MGAVNEPFHEERTKMADDALDIAVGLGVVVGFVSILPIAIPLLALRGMSKAGVGRERTWEPRRYEPRRQWEAKADGYEPRKRR